MLSNAIKKSSSFAFSGENTGIESSSAVSCTGLDVIFLFRPAGAGGCVTTASFAQTEKPMADKKMSKKEMKKTEMMKKDKMMKEDKMKKDTSKMMKDKM